MRIYQSSMPSRLVPFDVYQLRNLKKMGPHCSPIWGDAGTRRYLVQCGTRQRHRVGERQRRLELTIAIQAHELQRAPEVPSNGHHLEDATQQGVTYVAKILLMGKPIPILGCGLTPASP